MYYFDNIKKEYFPLSSTNLAPPGSQTSVKSFDLTKNVGYWANVREGTNPTLLELEYYSRLVSKIQTVNREPIILMELSNPENISDSRMEIFISQIRQSLDILDSLFETQQTNSVIRSRTIDISLRTLSGGTLGQAGGGVIIINKDNSGTSGLGKIEDETQTIERISSNIPIIIHEIMHVLGIGISLPGTNSWTGRVGQQPLYYNGENIQGDQLLTTTGYIVDNLFYNGTNAVQKYNELIQQVYSLDNFFLRFPLVPIEEGGGGGTRKSHWEEHTTNPYQKYIDNYPSGSVFVPGIIAKLNSFAYRQDGNGRNYPAFQEELMSGYLNSNNYISIVTLGAFEDAGYIVNYDSEYVSKPPPYPSNYSAL